MNESTPILRLSEPASGIPAYVRTHVEAIDEFPELPNMEDYFTRTEILNLLAQYVPTLVSPDGTVWIETISNDGEVSWVRQEEQSGNQKYK